MITASIVPEQERLNFYPSITQQFVFLENSIYRFSDEFLKEYHGAYWEFVTLDNGGKFAYPVMNTQVTLDNPHNYSSGSFSQEAAGMCIWLIALSFCAIVAFEKGDFAEMENFSYHQVRLMEYAREHSEWDNIARVID
ncbi:antirestriction protein [Vibrio parahaemolyticus]|uniref:antirestriction protein n=1 Tax=Vibrio parahaemolyticus TaxID=670 RepID=UPI00101EB1B4|nr:antirestriction protein [Vibrio parahaemolyticus]